MFVLNKISYNNYYKYTIVITILIFYLFLTGCSPSILRTTIMTIAIIINKLLNLKIKKLDIMLITLIIAIIINPFIIYEVGFQYSYTISLSLNIMSKKINTKKSSLVKNLYTSIICFIVSFPICIYNFYQVNFLGIILNLIMIPFVSIIVFPLTLITFIFPIVYDLYILVINVLEFINTLASNINVFTINFMKPSFIVVIFYYILITTILLNTKYIFLLVIFIMIHKIYPYLNSDFVFTVLDVGQGDSLLINYPNNKCNILIDTGGTISYNQEKWQIKETEYSIAKFKTIPYLKSLGITKLDYLIITHGDYDHMGESINLVKNFKVDKVIFNNDEYNDLELEFIKILENKNIQYYQNIKELNIYNNKLYFLNNKIYDNENDNSNIIYTNFNGIKLLLMGDSGIGVEENIIKKYNLNNIDILKVGHHGSKTSSSEKFIDKINPKYSIISVGKNNRYGHPNNIVLENLEDTKIYRTDQDGSIMFKIKNNKLEIKTCMP